MQANATYVSFSTRNGFEVRGNRRARRRHKKGYTAKYLSLANGCVMANVMDSYHKLKFDNNISPFTSHHWQRTEFTAILKIAENAINDFAANLYLFGLAWLCALECHWGSIHIHHSVWQVELGDIREMRAKNKNKNKKRGNQSTRETRLQSELVWTEKDSFGINTYETMMASDTWNGIVKFMMKSLVGCGSSNGRTRVALIRKEKSIRNGSKPIANAGVDAIGDAVMFVSLYEFNGSNLNSTLRCERTERVCVWTYRTVYPEALPRSVRSTYFMRVSFVYCNTSWSRLWSGLSLYLYYYYFYAYFILVYCHCQTYGEGTLYAPPSYIPHCYLLQISNFTQINTMYSNWTASYASPNINILFRVVISFIDPEPAPQ